MSDQEIKQIYDANPSAALADTDLIYLGKSPYGAGNDSAILVSSIFPSSSDNNAVATFFGTNGKLLQSSPVLIDSSGYVTGGIWQGGIISGAYGGTGKNNGGVTLDLIAGAGAGKILTSDAFGNATWQNAPSSGVTAIVGVAGQVLANGTSGSSQTGSVTLTLPQSIATNSTVEFGQLGIGSSPAQYFDVKLGGAGIAISGRIFNTSVIANSFATFILQSSVASVYHVLVPNNTVAWAFGADATDANKFKICNASDVFTNAVLTVASTYVYVTSALTIGSASPQANTAVTVSASGQHGYFLTGTLSAASAALYSARLNNVLSPTTAFSTYGYAFTGTFNAQSGRTIPNAYGFYSEISTTAAGGTITSLFNFYATGVSNTGASIGNVYGYFSAGMTAGTNRYGAWFAAPTGGTVAIACYTDNLAVGYNTTPPSAGAIISGNTSIGSSSATSLFNVGSSNQFQINSTGQVGIGTAPSTTVGVNLSQTLSAGSGTLTGLRCVYTLNANSATTVTNAYNLYASLSLTGNAGTISNASGIYVDAGTTAGAVTTGYGIFVAAIGYGSTRYAIYASAPTGGSTNYGAFIGGASGFNTAPSTDTAVAIAGLTSSGRHCLYLGGTSSLTATDVYAVRNVVTLTPQSSSYSAFAYTAVPTFTSTASGINGVHGFYNYNIINGSGTIASAAGITIDTGSLTGASVTTGYGILVNAIAFGGTRYGLYVASPTGGTTNYAAFIDNVFINYQNLYALYVAKSLTATSGSLASVNIAGSIGASSGTLSEAGGLSFYTNFGSNVGTISAAYGISVGSGNAGGTITTGYGVLVNPLSFGSTRYGIYVSAPTGGTTNYGGVIMGACGINLSAPNTAFTLTAAGLGSAGRIGFYLTGSQSLAGFNQAAMQCDTSLTPSSNSYNAYGLNMVPSVTSTASGINVIYSAVFDATISGSGTVSTVRLAYTGTAFTTGASVTSATGLYIDALAAGTTRYGLYVANQTGGTTNACAVFAGTTVFATGALATNATTGFMYIPTCAGAPTGVPASFTGTVAHIYDTTNNRLYVYNGGWKSVLLS